MIFEVVSAEAATMPIINCKEWTFRPSLRIFVLRSRHVQNDWYSIFIIISLNTLMSVGWVTGNQAMRFWSILGVFKFFQWVVILLTCLHPPFNLCVEDIFYRVPTLWQEMLVLTLHFLYYLVEFTITILQGVLLRLNDSFVLLIRIVSDTIFNGIGTVCWSICIPISYILFIACFSCASLFLYGYISKCYWLVCWNSVSLIHFWWGVIRWIITVLKWGMVSSWRTWLFVWIELSSHVCIHTT